jgi:serine/threonine protein kinase
MSLNLYPIIKKIGEGGFGTTYLATNTLLPTRPTCVVKKLTPTSNDPRLQQLLQDRFKQEAIALENLSKGSNGKIPTLYHYFVEQGEFCLVQEYIDGQTLTEKIRTHGKFTETQVREILNDLLATLNYVHQKGIIHRDIKPENIMVRYSDNKPVLIDFGAVKEIMNTVMSGSENTGRSIAIGTPGFMPMEQVSGRPVFASDLYALSLTAIYLLTGKTPGEIETDPHSGNINWRVYAANVSPQLAQVLNKSIEYSPRDRYSSAQEMLQSLSADPSQSQTQPTIVTPIPNTPEKTVYVPTPTPVSNNYPSPEKSQPNPIFMALVGVVLGGALIAGGLVLGKNSGGDKTAMLPPIPSTPNPPTSPVSPPVTQTTPSTILPPPTQPSIPINNNSTISREAAINTIQQWLQYKRVLFAPPYNKQASADLLTGKAYRNNIDRSAEPCNSADSGDCLSSVDWLQRYNAQYSFGVQRIDKIDKFESSGDTGTIFVTVTEYRTLHKSSGRSTPSGGTSQVRYDLQFENGKVKITDYK